MKLLFFSFLIQLSTGYAEDVLSLRKLYYEASVKKDSAKRFMDIMNKLEVESDPLLLCYKGMANLIQANYSFNPYNKLSYFNKGKEMLEKSIKEDPQNIEIRFMRFCVQTNAPFFLEYSANVNTDKAIILREWNEIQDKDLKEKIKIYMLESKACTTTEKLIFK